MEKLKDFTGDDARGLTLVERMDKTGARFLAEGVVPVQQKLAESQFTEAIALLLKQTNPRFEEFRETIAAVNGFAVDAASRLVQTAAESARME
ncbi:MAG: hypothetical protein LBI87_05105 [Candidatus Accumulibacter sp.]|jgi:hypothetical protein|nr:hypothetical protein [Accumulibacter sp.]